MLKTKTTVQMILAGAMIALQTPIASAALVAHWKLDESSSPFTEQVSGDSNSVAQGTLAYSQAGLAPGGGTSIGMTNDASPNQSFIRAGSVTPTGIVADPDMTSDYTVTGLTVLANQYTFTGWVNINELGGTQTLLTTRGHVSTSGSWFMMTVGSGGNVTANRQNTAVTTSATLSAGTTYLIAFSVDNTLSEDQRTISIWDGSSWTTESFDGNLGAVDLFDIGLGANFNGVNQLNGRLDDVRIYDHALTQSELNALVLVVPEPASLALLGLGGLLMLFARRRRRA